MRMFSGLYSLAWGLARPLLRRNKRLADGFVERLVPPDWAGAADVWVQAASGGEARLACALIDALLEAPARQAESVPPAVLVTTWTRQGRDILDAKAATLPPGVLRVRFAPLDDPAITRRAVAQARPRLLVLLETELWPGLLLACKEAGVPVLVVNGRMRDSTLRNYLWCAGLWRNLAPAGVTAISAADAGRFARLFPGIPCETLSNIKFDQAVPPAGARGESPDIPPALCAALTGAERRPVIVLASVREEEEALLCEVVREKASVPLRFVIAPRHMHRVEAWGAHLDRLGCVWSRRSERTAEVGDVVLWDAFGELPWLYNVADAVFVGGSLARLGGQNFLEPLAAGVIPCVGPHLDNFAWALTGGTATEFGPSLTELGLLRIVPDAAGLCGEVRAAGARGLLRDADKAATRARFAAWLAPRQGGAAAQAGRILARLHEKDRLQAV